MDINSMAQAFKGGYDLFVKEESERAINLLSKSSDKDGFVSLLQF